MTDGMEKRRYTKHNNKSLLVGGQTIGKDKGGTGYVKKWVMF